MTVAEVGRGYVRMALANSEPEPEPEPDADVTLLGQGYATVTPIRSVSEAPDVELPWEEP